ncbi:hypothetical protein MLD38_021560 [Melastoma candidum]|uniref:Uncharacterized protein n=1 Tax=Melastoma candidum TaxID=119954 RepID=A0ACB9QHP5_9MYRT|nr:hypothetical protein MLD38_021560 [Melastoma candidum]
MVMAIYLKYPSPNTAPALGSARRHKEEKERSSSLCKNRRDNPLFPPLKTRWWRWHASLVDFVIRPSFALILSQNPLQRV